jgi:uncharacterized protein
VFVNAKEKSGMNSTSSIGEIQTPLAASYLQRLCKHFSLEIPTEYNGSEGVASFPFGQCRLLAETQTLTFHCEAEDSAALDRLQEVIAKHVVMFTQRNPVTLTWRTQTDIETSKH